MLAERVREARLARGLRQVDLAKKSGVASTHISLIETGAGNPLLHTIQRLANALEVDPAWLSPKAVSPDEEPGHWDLRSFAHWMIDQLPESGRWTREERDRWMTFFIAGIDFFAKVEPK